MNEIVMKKESCPDCGVNFSTKSNLKRHLKNKKCKTKDILKNKSIINLIKEEENEKDRQIELKKLQSETQLEIQRKQEEEMMIKEQEKQKQEAAEKLRLEQEKKQQIEAEKLRLEEENRQREEEERLRLEQERRFEEEKKQMLIEAEIRQREEEERLRLEEEKRIREDKEQQRIAYENKLKEIELRKQIEERRTVLLEIQRQKEIEEEQKRIEEREQKRREEIAEKNRIEKENEKKRVLNKVEENLKLKIERQHKELENETKEVKDRLKHYAKEIDELKNYYEENLQTIMEREKIIIERLEDETISDDDYLKMVHYSNQLTSFKKELETRYGKEMNELKKLYTETVKDRENVYVMKNELIDTSYIINDKKIEKMDAFKEAMLYMNQKKRKNEMKTKEIHHRNKSYKTRKGFLFKNANKLSISHFNLPGITVDLKNINGTISINGNKNHNKTMKSNFRKINICS